MSAMQSVDNSRFGILAFLMAATLIVWGCLLDIWMMPLCIWGAFSYSLLGMRYLQIMPLWAKNSSGMTGLGAVVSLPYLVFTAGLLGLMRVATQTRARQIVSMVWLGPWPLIADGPRNGFDRVLDLTEELPRSPRFRNAEYLCLPILDGTSPDLVDLDRAVEFIEAGVVMGQTVLVHCAMGRSRSSTCIAAWLLASNRANNVLDAFGIIHASQPFARPSRSQQDMLATWASKPFDADMFSNQVQWTSRLIGPLPVIAVCSVLSLLGVLVVGSMRI